MKEGKIRIFQADDNDQCDNKINKFFIVIKILLSYLNINEKNFEIPTNHNITFFDYNSAKKEINKSFDYITSADILTVECNNLEDVKDIFTAEIFDIYIIDLNWGKNKDGGLELLKIIENRVPSENIIIFSNYSEYVAENYSSEKHSNEIKTVLTRNINELLPERLSHAIKKIREKIINDCSPRDKEKMRNAISYNSYNFFKGEISYNDSLYSFKNLYLDYPNIKCEDIAKDITKILKTDINEIRFVGSSLMNATKDTYFKEFIEKKEFKIINELLNFASVNYFLQIFFNLEKVENIFIRKDKLLEFNNPSKEKVYKNGWIPFYKLLILRRVIILWSANHTLLKDLNDEPFYQFSQLIHYGKVSNEKELPVKMEFNLISKKAGFFAPYHDLTINNNLLIGEIELIEKCSINKLENIIKTFKEINKRISQSRYGNQNECFDFWDIKSSRNRNNFIHEIDFNNYNYDINEMFNSENIDKEFKKYIFNNNIKDTHQLLIKIIGNNLE